MTGYKRRILVVGTTRDYIEQIFRDYPERIIFLTDPAEYGSARPAAGGDCELVYPLIDPEAAIERLMGFLAEKNISIGGVACFDCESLLLAGEIAERLSLPFPGRAAIERCRDKFQSKILWRAAGVGCPRISLARSERDVLNFIDEAGLPAIMKPLTLSGSELVLRCETRGEAVEGFKLIREELKKRSLNEVANRDRMIGDGAVLCEEFIEGDEYSCDFFYDGGELKIIRTARKHLLEGGPPGTVMAYEIPAPDDAGLAPELEKAIEALELGRSMGMVDYIRRGDKYFFLEITPRPGGDCLPMLIKKSGGFDIIAAHLDFAEGTIPPVPGRESWRHLAGLRVHATRAGMLGKIVTGKSFEQDVLEECWYRKEGDRVDLPPGDYRSWLLGHVIFRVGPDMDTAGQARALRSGIEIEIGPATGAGSIARV